MIKLTHGDILRADAEALVNTVNCVGIMGRGIALQFRKEFPDNYKLYKAACDKKQLHPGNLLVHDLNRFENPRYIINFPTKRHWKGKSRIEDIESGLKALVAIIHRNNIKSVALPPLGCGLGGLDWEDVRPLIENTLCELTNVDILLFEPKGAPAPLEMAKDKKIPRMTIGRAVLIGLVRRYMSAIMDPAISLLEIHKLMYFMQEAGENLRLRYSKGTYGPYAENLRHVLSHMEGHYITGYGDGADDPEIQIGLIPEAVENAEKHLQAFSNTRARFNRVAGLIQGFETPYGMELLSTVHWVATREQADTFEMMLNKTYSWNDRKKSFPETHMRITWDILTSQKWIGTLS